MKVAVTGILSLFLLSSCLQEVGSGSPNAEISSGNSLEETDPSVIAFSTSLHPLLVQNCASCHGDFQAPFFAYANEVKTSHDNLLNSNLADLDNPSSSRLVTKVASNHQCWTGNCQADSLSIQAQITSWASGGTSQQQEEETTVINSSIFNIPEDLPACTDTPAYKEYVFAMNTIEETVPEGTILGFQICSFDATSYQIQNLKLKNSVPVNLKGVHILFNAVDFSGGGNDWPELDQTYSASGSSAFDPAVVIKDNYFFVAKGFGLEDPLDGGPGKDTIQLQVERLILAE